MKLNLNSGCTATESEETLCQSTNYLEAKTNYAAFEWPKDSLSAPLSDTFVLFQYRDQMLSYALSAIVFQALAIEAYVNLFGVSELGNERFFTELEPKKI